MKATRNVFASTIICLMLIVVLPIQNVNAQTSEAIVSIVPSQNTVQIDDALILNVTIANVQNLYGLDITVNWNNSMLQISNVNDQLGVESYPGGVLHEAPSYPVEIALNETSQEIGEYHIVATSQGQASPFGGEGTVVILKFIVLNAGQSNIRVYSELADHPAPGETNSEPINHEDFGATVNAQSIPEFPQTIILVLLLVCVSIVLLLQRKIHYKKGKKA